MDNPAEGQVFMGTLHKIMSWDYVYLKKRTVEKVGTKAYKYDALSVQVSISY